MKGFIYRFVLCGVLALCLYTEGTAQFRYGVYAGPAFSTHEYDNIFSGIYLGARGENRFSSGYSIYTAPAFLLRGYYHRLELPFGIKYPMTNGSASLYLSVGLTAAIQKEKEYNDFLSIDGTPQIAPFTYKPFMMLLHTGLGFEVGSIERSAFTIELRYAQGLTSISDDRDCCNIYVNEISCIIGFLFR